MSERWKWIPGLEDYQVSDMGRVRSFRPQNKRTPRPSEPKLLALKVTTYGYHEFSACTDRGKKSRHVHPCVLEAFVGPRPAGHRIQACHNNGKPGDNRLENLRWDTEIANKADKLKHGTALIGSKNPNAVLDENAAFAIKKVAKYVPRVADVHALFPIYSEGVVRDVMSGKTWRHV